MTRPDQGIPRQATCRAAASARPGSTRPGWSSPGPCSARRSSMALLWVGGLAAAVLTGHHLPARRAGTVLAGLRTLAHPGDPSRGWRTAMPGPVPYWIVTGLLIAAIAAACVVAARALHRAAVRRRHHPDRIAGLAARAEIRDAVSARALLRRGPILRPSLTSPAPGDLGYRIGTARGIDVWTAVEDSMLILGPPRSGKGRHLVIPMLRAAPGPVVTTSTRPDNIAATLPPDKPAAPSPSSTPNTSPPTSPTTGTAATERRRDGGGDGGNRNGHGSRRECWGAVVAGARLRRPADRDDPRPRARRRQRRPDREPQLLAGPDRDRAARVPARRRPRRPHRRRPVPVVPRPGRRRPRRPHPAHPHPIAGAAGGPTRSTPSSTATPAPATTPGPASAPPSPRSPTRAPSPPSPPPATATSWTRRSSSTATAPSTCSAPPPAPTATANLVAALIEDLVHTARRRAARSPGTRLDPPLALILDEAANYTLPSLPSLISEGGGTGITTIAVLQSLAQARARWGEHDGTAIYDAASSKIILGGSTNARDLHDLAQLIGERDEHTHTTSYDGTGRRGTSTATRRVPIVDPAALRALPYGTALLLHRADATNPDHTERSRAVRETLEWRPADHGRATGVAPAYWGRRPRRLR